MENLFFYLLKSSGLVAAFYLAYFLLLRKETFFNSNRWFLLSGLATSVILPLVTFEKVILVDDVLWTGRTIRAALDALLDFGRPQKVELCVLIDRRFNRELPIQPDYTGRAIDTIVSQKVKVFWKENGTKECVELE